ncbi:unnamed protein product [Candidula unifasciata]|uniref:T-box domain-containing protein n=1 Tax=Candidula unifasciata TaxID=100452 RepID=A0A8S4A2P8_9EUPU|nr:unnamed protein product [Candidula unifasciata]
MTLSCRAQAFSVENLLRMETSTVANSSSPQPRPLTLQRQFPKLQAHSWTTNSRPLTTPEFLITSTHNNTSHVLNSNAFENSTNTFLLHHDLSDSSIVVELCHSDLWTSFHRLGTEMIITKSGRRMFPALKMRINNLNPDKHYIVRLEFLQPDTRKYRYIYHSSRWMVSGSGDKLTTPQLHVSPERPASGQAICSQTVSFERLKLTNAEPSRTGQVSLISMQKFQPQVVIQEVYNTDCSDVEHSEQYVITFPQTSFMAVTAYQNQQVTTLKIASNPFAKGFRESGKARIPFESFVTGLPNLLTYNSSASYLPGLIKPSTWPCCFQQDLNSNFINESCDTHSSVSTCEDHRAKLFKTEVKNCKTNCLNFDMKRDNSSVHEVRYKSQETIADHHLLPHSLHLQQRQEEDLKQQLQRQQRLSTQHFKMQALFHPLPVNVELLRHIPVPTIDILTHEDPSQFIPIQKKVLALPRSEHIKSEHPFNQLSDVYIKPTNSSTANSLS